MNVQFNTDAVRQRSAPVPAAGRAQERRLFLLTPSEEECGVESFARLLVSALQNDYPDDGYAVLAVSSRWRDLPAVFRKIAAADQIVFSVPLVAWKRLLLLPLVVLLFARLVRCRVNVFMHEWGALHGLRRLALTPFVLLSRTIMVVSPYIAGRDRRHALAHGCGEKMPAGAECPDHPPAQRATRHGTRFAFARCRQKLRCGDRLFRRDL